MRSTYLRNLVDQHFKSLFLHVISIHSTVGCPQGTGSWRSFREASLLRPGVEPRGQSGHAPSPQVKNGAELSSTQSKLCFIIIQSGEDGPVSRNLFSHSNNIGHLHTTLWSVREVCTYLNVKEIPSGEEKTESMICLSIVLGFKLM